MKKNLTHLYYKNTNEFANTNSGITLIALVVTVIVLLILVGVTLDLVSGSNGIITKATKASDANAVATAKEQVTLQIAEWITELYDRVYVQEDVDVNTKAGDWIYGEHHASEANPNLTTDEYRFIIELSPSDDTDNKENAKYRVRVLKQYGDPLKTEERIKEDIKGYLTQDGTLSFPSSESGGTTDETIDQETDVSYFTFELVNDSNSSYCYNNNYDGYVITGLSEAGITAAGNEELKNITLPSEYNGKPVVSIGCYATDNEAWSYVEKIVVPSSIKSIESNSLCCISAYETNVIFKEGLENVEYTPFYHWNGTNDQYIKLPNSVKKLAYINGSYSRFKICVGKNIEEVDSSFYGTPLSTNVVFFDGTLEELNNTIGFKQKIYDFYVAESDINNANYYWYYINVFYCLSDNTVAVQTGDDSALSWIDIDLNTYIDTHVSEDSRDEYKNDLNEIITTGKNLF